MKQKDHSRQKDHCLGACDACRAMAAPAMGAMAAVQQQLLQPWGAMAKGRVPTTAMGAVASSKAMGLTATLPVLARSVTAETMAATIR